MAGDARVHRLGFSLCTGSEPLMAELNWTLILQVCLGSLNRQRKGTCDAVQLGG